MGRWGRPRLVVLAALLVLAATVISGSRVWLRGTSAESGLAGGVVTATGAQAVPGLVALGLVIGAATVAAAAGGRVVRRVTLVVAGGRSSGQCAGQRVAVVSRRRGDRRVHRAGRRVGRVGQLARPVPALRGARRERRHRAAGSTGDRGLGTPRPRGRPDPRGGPDRHRKGGPVRHLERAPKRSRGGEPAREHDREPVTEETWGLRDVKNISAHGWCAARSTHARILLVPIVIRA